MLQHLSKVQIAVAWSVIFLAGVAGGWVGKERERERVLTELSDDTKRCAVAFEGAELRRLTGSRADTAAHQDSPVHGFEIASCRQEIPGTVRDSRPQTFDRHPGADSTDR